MKRLLLLLALASAGCTTVRSDGVTGQRLWFSDKVRICNDKTGDCTKWMPAQELMKHFF